MDHTRPRFILELEGKTAGRCFAVRGGRVKHLIDDTNHPRASAVTVRHEDIVLTCGTSMSREFYNWAGSVNGSSLRKHGAIIALDERQMPAARLEFQAAFVRSLVLPALDNTSTDEAVLTLTISSQVVSHKGATGSSHRGAHGATHQKPWLCSNFRLSIDGLENECMHVSKIGSLRLGPVKARHVSHGANRLTQSELIGADSSDLTISLPSKDSDAFRRWFDESIRPVGEAPSTRKAGTLTYLAPDSIGEYFVVKFSALQIHALNGGAPASAKSALPVTITMDCDSMTFHAPAAIP